MSLNTIDNMTICFEKKNKLFTFSIPTENVAAIRTRENVVVAPPRNFFNFFFFTLNENLDFDCQKNLLLIQRDMCRIKELTLEIEKIGQIIVKTHLI